MEERAARVARAVRAAAREDAAAVDWWAAACAEDPVDSGSEAPTEAGREAAAGARAEVG